VRDLKHQDKFYPIPFFGVADSMVEKTLGRVINEWSNACSPLRPLPKNSEGLSLPHHQGSPWN
jgi:hypothetical protein